MPITPINLVDIILFPVVSRLTAAVFLTFGLLAPGFAQDAALFKCAQLLSADQLKATVGAGMVAAAPKQHQTGESECVWRRGNSAATVSLAMRFFDRRAINSNPVSRTLDGFYEMLVTAGEEAGEKKREPVVGLPRASLVQADAQILVVVQRTDGVARVVFGNFSRAQAVAVARAISAN